MTAPRLNSTERQDAPPVLTSCRNQQNFPLLRRPCTVGLSAVDIACVSICGWSSAHNRRFGQYYELQQYDAVYCGTNLPAASILMARDGSSVAPISQLYLLLEPNL